jgi:hypothetical protein
MKDVAFLISEMSLLMRSISITMYTPTVIALSLK